MVIDEEELELMAELLRGQALTVGELEELFPRRKKAIYRWLKALEARGETVIRIGVGNPARYRITDATL